VVVEVAAAVVGGLNENDKAGAAVVVGAEAVIGFFSVVSQEE